MSLVQLGARSPREPTVAELLLECHARIRAFTQLAVQLPAPDAPDAEIADAAARVHRYFTQALPLHVADEELSIAPRLRLLVPDALAAMEREHRAHEELLASLVPAWAALREHPDGRRATHAPAARLQSVLEEHLAAEERLVIPALARLPAVELGAIAAEMRRRRS
jgi:hypothetical protein